MKVLSLFSGGGLGDYGLELAGMEIIGQVEIDDYCQKILALRWPNVPKWRDIRQVGGADVIKTCGPVDLISGGFPCQDISTAGKCAGITGARSGLWKEMHRLICEIRPRYVLVENVTALLGRGLGTVLGDLAESGYDTEWDCIPASALGAPHQRDRVWIVAHSRSGGFWKQDACSKQSNGAKAIRSSSALSKRKNSRKQNTTKGRPDSHVANTNGARLQTHRSTFYSTRFEFNRKQNHWTVEPNVGRVAHGVASRVDRLKLLGNGQVVQVVEWIGKQIINYDKY